MRWEQGASRLSQRLSNSKERLRQADLITILSKLPKNERRSWSAYRVESLIKRRWHVGHSREQWVVRRIVLYLQSDLRHPTE